MCVCGGGGTLIHVLFDTCVGSGIFWFKYLNYIIFLFFYLIFFFLGGGGGGGQKY